MKAGTIVRLPDGREGTVVYHGLDGYGIRWGRIDVDMETVMAGNGGLHRGAESDAERAMIPEAMLRAPYAGCDKSMEYVGGEYEAVDD